jgi:uncharacterized membrane protein YphA (DoxX/SURF4 family)
MQIFRVVVKIILSGIFVYSGWIKLQDPHGFEQSITSFKLIPPVIIPFVASTIPPLEIIAALLLHWKRTQGGAATCITLLCLGFCVFYAYAWKNGIHPSCGCFGSSPLLEASPPQGLARAAFIGVLAGLMIPTDFTKRSIAKVK